MGILSGIAKRARIAVGTGLFFSALGLLIIYFGREELRPYVEEPVELTAGQLARLAPDSPLRGRIVRLRFDAVEAAGVAESRQNGSDLGYYFGKGDGRTVFVTKSSAPEGNVLTGRLSYFTDRYRERASAFLAREGKSLDGVLPYFLYAEEEGWAVLLLAAAPLLFGLVLVFGGLFRRGGLKLEKAVERYTKDRKAAYLLIREIDREIAATPSSRTHAAPGGKVHFTRNWLAAVTVFSVKLARLSEIVSAEPLEVVQRKYGIPIATTYWVKVRLTSGATEEFPIEKAEREIFLETLRGYAGRAKTA
jgi:hypothetical protein